MSLAEQNSFFTAGLLRWNRERNTRVMPWKGETDAYKIWLSEIILQQTRVEQGWKYFTDFTKKFPTIQQLAAAPEREIFKLWEGLGYYTRCKNLIETAKYISNELDGKFPSDYDSVIKLKGVGPYTAAAIVSFAFNLPYAVIDGNVQRVLARFFGIRTTIDTTEGKRIFSMLANQLLHKKQAGTYNQAIMDFGATICKPRQPLCKDCILSAQCIALSENAVNSYPVKSKKIIKRHRCLYYIIVETPKGFAIRKRTGNDIWQNLYEFFLIESEVKLNLSDISILPGFKKITGPDFQHIYTSSPYKQQLTHQTISGVFIHLRVENFIAPKDVQIVSKAKIAAFPFPRLIINFMADQPGIFSTSAISAPASLK